MKDIKTGTLWAIICMTSVVVMFIWSFIEGNWYHCWLAPMAGSIIALIISMVREDKEEATKKRKPEYLDNNISENEESTDKK